MQEWEMEGWSGWYLPLRSRGPDSRTSASVLFGARLGSAGGGLLAGRSRSLLLLRRWWRCGLDYSEDERARQSGLGVEIEKRVKPCWRGMRHRRAKRWGGVCFLGDCWWCGCWDEFLVCSGRCTQGGVVWTKKLEDLVVK